LYTKFNILFKGSCQQFISKNIISYLNKLNNFGLNDGVSYRNRLLPFCNIFSIDTAVRFGSMVISRPLQPNAHDKVLTGATDAIYTARKTKRLLTTAIDRLSTGSYLKNGHNALCV
jgi:hypothetical protein